MTLANDPIPKWWITSVITFGLALIYIKGLGAGVATGAEP